MEESGIDLGFDLASLCAEEFKTDQLQQILDDGMHYQRNQDLMYYELKSKTVPTNDSPPTFKTLTPTSRTQLKQQLMREHAQEQCRRESLQLQVQSQLNSKPRRPEVLPIPAPSTHHAVDLPPQVLQVRTMLDNPTRYHVIEKQRSQVRQYLSESFQPRQLSSECASTSVLSAPDLLTAPSPDYDAFTSGSGIFSPGLCSGTTSNSETDELLDDIMSLESRETAGSSGLALSCDADVKQETLPATDADIHALQKDRQKKDNHNMIERRRRFNINDRIKELGTLLPKTNDPFYEVVRDARPNKGTILKSSVDYIKCLKDEINKMKQNEHRRKQVEINNKKLLFRIKELEQQARRHGLPVSEFVWQPSQADNHPHHQTTQPDSHHHHHHTAESPHPPYSAPVSVSPSHLHAPPHAAPPPLEPHHHHQQYLSAPSLGCLTLEAPQGLPSLPASYLEHPIKLSMSPTPAMMISGDDHSAPDSTTVLSLTQIEDLMEDDAHNPVQGDPMLCSSPSSRLGVCLVDEEQPTMASILAEDNHMLNIDSSTGGGNPLLGDPSPHSLGLGLLSTSGLLGPPSGMLRGRSSHISDCFSDTDMDIGA